MGKSNDDGATAETDRDSEVDRTTAAGTVRDADPSAAVDVVGDPDQAASTDTITLEDVVMPWNTPPEPFEPGVSSGDVLANLDEDTVEALDAVDVDTDALAPQDVSYRMLLDAGVDPTVAADLRRTFSLPWSFDSDGSDLVERSRAVRGMGDAERAWVAASAGEWEDVDIPTPSLENREPATTHPKPKPVTDVPGVDDAYAERLAEAGIVSVRTLAIADPTRVSRVLNIELNRLTSWHWWARDHVEPGSLFARR
ncbi:MAG: DUF7409 domain-containing protein [Halobacteriota archaeon]